jgi:hypothetical protein
MTSLKMPITKVFQAFEEIFLQTKNCVAHFIGQCSTHARVPDVEREYGHPRQDGRTN